MYAPCKLRSLGWVAALVLIAVPFLELSKGQTQLAAAPQQRPATAGAEVTVTLAPGVAQVPVSGRLLVLFSTSSGQPITGPNWFSPQQFAGVDVDQWQGAKSVTLSGPSQAHPKSLAQMDAGTYFVQAVLRRNPDFAHHKDGPGNLYSQPAKVDIVAGEVNDLRLELTQSIAAKATPDTPTRIIVSRRSELLSGFHGRDVIDRALVLLPHSYATEPARRYPVYYEVTGFGPTIEDLLRRHKRSEIESGGVEFIHVMLTGQCQWGHHVYANSQTNGPRADALVKELIPAIESQFRVIDQPYARMVGGHSSGGWSSLWLQTQYPEFFGGVWSTAPDPVDFRDWQGTDLYADDANIFFDVENEPKPLAVANGRPVIWYRDFSQMDDVLQRGGQLRSFEAVFSPRGDDGLPVRCWDRESGKVNANVVDHWRQYDISQYLQNHWDQLRQPLAGKLHVFTGTEDTFLLTRAVELLGQRLQRLGSDAQIEIIPGKNHFNLIDANLRRRIHQSMAEKFNQGGGR